MRPELVFLICFYAARQKGEKYEKTKQVQIVSAEVKLK